MIGITRNALDLAMEFAERDTLPAPPPDDDCEVDVEECWRCDGTKSIRTLDASYSDPGDWRECPHCGDSAT